MTKIIGIFVLLFTLSHHSIDLTKKETPVSFKESEYKEAFKYMMVRYPGYFKLCNEYANLDTCGKFVKAQVSDSLFYYEAFIWGHNSPRFFLAGGKWDLEGEYHYYLGGRLLTFKFIPLSSNKLVLGQNYQIGQERAFTIDKKLESTGALKINIPNNIDKKELKKIRLILSWLSIG